jgi:hypothetical protein
VRGVSVPRIGLHQTIILGIEWTLVSFGGEKQKNYLRILDYINPLHSNVGVRIFDIIRVFTYTELKNWNRFQNYF